MNALIRLVLITIASSGSIALAQFPSQVPVCTDRQSRQVPVVVDERVPTYAAAFYSPELRRPVIVVNPKIAAQFTERFNAWVYLHECAHVVLGHVDPKWTLAARINGQETFERNPDQQVKELDADCWGAKSAVRNGYIRNVTHVSEIIRQMVDWPEDKDHPSGEVRSRNFLRCAQ